MISKKKIVTLIIRQNALKEAFRIERDGGVIRSYEKFEVDSKIVTKIAINIARNISKKEKVSVTIRDAFSSEILTCSNCHSENVSSKLWQNMNTGTLDTVSLDEEDSWCEDCEGHHDLTTNKVKNLQKGREIFTIIA